MAILNYYTKADVKDSVAEIVAALMKVDALSINQTYDRATRRPNGIEFAIEGPRGDLYYRLPVRVDQMLEVLVKQHREQRLKSAKPDRYQAERVAWRIVKDWIEAQVALIQSEVVRLDEVMLPYLLTDKGETMYQLWEGRMKQLPEGKTD